MNENLLVVLLAVIIFVLLIIAGMVINIAFNMKYLEKIALRINIMINDLDLLIARADTVIAHFDDEDEHSKTISNKLDVIIANQDDLRNVVHTGLVKTRDVLNNTHAVQCDTHKAVVEFKDRTANDIVKMRGELDSIFEGLDRNHRELNLIFNDTHKILEGTKYIHSVEAEKNRKKKLKKKKRNDESEIIDGECEDCMSVFIPENKEPCVNCSHAYTTKFVSRRE